MTEPPSVTAGWAVWSKHPGTRDDYAVLACSDGPLSKGEFAQIVAYFAPGNPSAEADTPGSLPWLTLSRVGAGAELYLCISVQVGTDDKDFTGRPISSTSFFCVPYAELTGHPVTYQDLFMAVSRPGLIEGAGRSVIPLTIPPLEAAALLDRAAEEKLDLEAAAATAAMLLAGPVTITGPTFPPLATRLLFFDVVAALLPYGYRTYLTASTWSDTGAGDRFRLVFAERARDEASRVRWDSPPRPADGGPAKSYLDSLLQVVRNPDKGRLAALIGSLANDTEPHKFDEPAHAVNSLHEFLRPELLTRRIDAGNAALDEIRQLLRGDRVREVPAPQGKQMLRQLIAGADMQDMNLITRWYDELAGGDTAVFTDVATACRGRLWTDGSTSLSREYLSFMRFRGLSDELLARLVARPDARTSAARGLEAIGRLLVESVATSVTGPDSFPKAQRAIGGNPPVAAALLARLSSRDTGARILEGAVAWLNPVADRVVLPFVSLLRDALPGGGPAGEAVTAAAIEDLDRYGERASVWYLLRAAAGRNSLHLVLPGLSRWLLMAAVERGRVAEKETRYWREVSMELRPAATDEAAWLDLVLLITGNEPRALLAGTYGQPQFSRQLASAWQELTAGAGGRGAVADKVLEDALIQFLGRVPWRTDRVQSDAVLALVRALTTGAERPRLMAVVLDPEEILRQMPPGAAADEIARACVRACRSGLSRRHAGEALIRSGTITSAEKAVAVIEYLRVELMEAGKRAESHEWPQEFAVLFARGAAGQPPVQDFPVVAARRFSGEVVTHIALLETVMRHSPSGAPPAVNTELGKYLERSRNYLDKVIKEAAKRLSPAKHMGGLLGGKGDGKHEGAPAAAEPDPGTARAGQNPESGAGEPADGANQGGQR